jgi:hypothetical protein
LTEWIDAKKELPIDDHDVIVWDGMELAVGYWYNGQWYLYGRDHDDCDVEYWMDVDEPKEAEDE